MCDCALCAKNLDGKPVCAYNVFDAVRGDRAENKRLLAIEGECAYGGNNAQVAELAGVSRGTVDRVMHGRPNVNPMVREKVLRAAEKLGYTCKKAAAAPTHRASILIPQWTDTYFNRQVISGIRRALRYIADNSFELVEVPLRTMTSPGACRRNRTAGAGRRGRTHHPRGEHARGLPRHPGRRLIRGIRVITYDGDIPDSGRACFVGQDLMKAGAIAAGVMGAADTLL